MLAVLLEETRDIPEVPILYCVDGSFGVVDVSVSGISTPSGSGKLWCKRILKLTPPEVVELFLLKSSVVPRKNTRKIYQA